jgi:SAM-dependent methyltransferase
MIDLILHSNKIIKGRGINLMTEPADPANQWSESDSASFINLAEIFVPGRTEQIAALLHLIPAQADETFTIVELASGEGRLAEAVLENFSACHYIALDGSELMRTRMAQRLVRFSSRLEIRPFDIAEQAWRTTLPTPLRAVLSSLCVHHLSAQGKQKLFQDVANHLETGGALLLADIIEPATPHVAQLFARQYDAIVRQQSLALRGNLSGYEQFQAMKWNYFTYDYGEQTYDQPSQLSDQVRWLSSAGFTHADCYWLRAGHAVYGGYR